MHRALAIELLDLLFILLLTTNGSPSGRFGVFADGVTNKHSDTSTLLPKREEGVVALASSSSSSLSTSTSSRFHQVHFQDRHHQQQHHHHHVDAALPLSAISSTSSSPLYLRDFSWLSYTSENDNEPDEKMRGSYNYDKRNMISRSNNNINSNSSSLMAESTSMATTFNDSMEDSFGNGTDMYDDMEEGSPFQSALPWWRQMIWSILFGAMVVVACTGNVTVIWIVLAHKRMRSVTNYLLVNLSIADALSSTLNVIPNYSYMLTGHWPFGALYCKIVQFVSCLCICSSVFSLMAIAFDRYMAIMNPLRPRMGKRLTLGIAGSIWVFGAILSMPMLIFFQTYERVFDDHRESIVICYSEWPDGAMLESFSEYVYNVFFMIFTYFVPIGVMGFTYTRVGVELWSSKSIGECTQRQLDNIKSKRRVVKMMIVVVSIFAICWLPYHSYFIFSSLHPEITSYPFVQEVYLGFYWLAMSNSCYNPIIYCWMNSRFRRGFAQVFQWCPFVQFDEEERGTTAYMMHTQRERETTRYSSVAGSPTLTRVSRNGTGSVHIHLHVMTNDPGRSPSSRLTNTNSNNLAVSPTQGHSASGLHYHNGNVSAKHQTGGGNNFHQHHSQCHHLQRNFSSGSGSRGNTMV